MVQAALKAGRGLTRDFGEVEHLQVFAQGPGNFVSRRPPPEKVLIGELKKARPTWPILSEERARSKQATGSTLHRRPAGRTTNFLHSIPLFAVSIGLEREGELVAGVITTRSQRTERRGERQRGIPQRPAPRVAARRELGDAVWRPACGRRPPGPRIFRGEHAGCGGKNRRRATLGSGRNRPRLVGAGRFDGCWQRGTAALDVAAGIVIVREPAGYYDLDASQHARRRLDPGRNERITSPAETLAKAS